MAPTRLQRLNKYYLSVSDIQIILGISFAKAKELFKIAEAQMLSEYEFIAHEHKVELWRVLKIAHIDETLLRKQIESEEKGE